MGNSCQARATLPQSLSHSNDATANKLLPFSCFAKQKALTQQTWEFWASCQEKQKTLAAALQCSVPKPLQLSAQHKHRSSLHASLTQTTHMSTETAALQSSQSVAAWHRLCSRHSHKMGDLQGSHDYRRLISMLITHILQIQKHPFSCLQAPVFLMRLGQKISWTYGSCNFEPEHSPFTTQLPNSCTPLDSEIKLPL